MQWLKSKQVQITAIILFLSITGFYSKPFFRDFIIVFEGTYRLFLGQIPYTDFFIPTTPLSYYLPLPFFYLFGPTVTALMALTSVMSVILALIFYKEIKKEVPFIAALFLCIAGFFCFNGKFNYPYYSTSVPYFFVSLAILNLVSSLKQKTLSNKNLFTISMLLLASLLSKQDVGAVSTTLITLYLFYFKPASFKNIFKYFILPYIIGIVAVGGHFLYRTDFLEHIYIGGKGMFATSINPLHFITSIPFSLTAWFIVIASVLWFKIKEKRAYLGLIIVFCSTAYITSFFTTSIYEVRAVPLVISLYLFYEVLKDRSQKVSKQKQIAALVFIAIVISNSGALFSRYIIGSFAYTPFTKQSPKMLPQYTRLSRSYKGVPILKEHHKPLQEIRALIKENQNSFINLSEYQFLYSDYNVAPPKPFPLNFHHGLYFFDEDLPTVMTTIEKSKAKLIFVQNHHPSQDPHFLSKFKKKLELLGYKYYRSFNAPTGPVMAYKLG
ncbi:hypothetical protein DID80_06180 [Candidatus Marinamargulisbacteria bacterium SCGC AAA071-K20]|nr:hypothetical protein DID80_06180 [Candidatus Marinamargulisbacteria bacterium SCGC AAA071-K20]